ncbi:putative haloacid dehalogenase-like hydrolase [Cupriavidus taiwanensis]|uniref:HAD family hydrolase n=1 Tax=Cupriavidus taiwanensis TaxID=164546 RepID=UPI000E19013A|nr:HAD family phosphatase [Cupriavidus taiwanensis]SOZ14801.1 putative haloacid dehalogenase-like hydrolase [Cupriavidus taiwanensis]SOZ26587.1 putative haloacid dehalogenase-like hydrolase [Cupriavidus taiwanensis]SOZ45376.1 putative haloacid dehalogenase-like hydrolase [Cupriavidus taiwanensis]
MTAATPGYSGRFDCVIFDCDGVLVDSEPIVNRVLNQMLNELGIEISLEDSTRLFLGRAVREELDMIERMRGAPLPENWLSTWLARRNAVLEEEVAAVAHVREAIRAVAATGMPVCVASGADRVKVKLQLTKTGLVELFQQDQREHIFSATEVARSKPAPDVYLLAARTMGVEPARCAVVEDSPTGVTAGVAAGMTVFGYAARNDAAQLREAGARTIFTDMRELPELVG